MLFDREACKDCKLRLQDIEWNCFSFSSKNINKETIQTIQNILDASKQVVHESPSVHAWSKVCCIHYHFSLWSLSLVHAGSTTGTDSTPPWHVYKSFVSSTCIQQFKTLAPPKTFCSSFHLSNKKVILKTNSLLSWKQKSLITHKTKPDWFISRSGLVFSQLLVRVVTQCSSLEKGKNNVVRMWTAVLREAVLRDDTRTPVRDTCFS